MNSKFLNFYYRLQDKEGKKNLIITVGVIKQENSMYSYIQVYSNVNKKTVYMKYDIEEFLMYINPQAVQIDNLFTLDSLQLNIRNINLNIFGKVKFIESISPKYDIMGPFSKLRNIPCRTGIFNMYSKVEGEIYLEKEKLDFNSGTLYIQGESGDFFPEKYIWYNSDKITHSKVSNDLNAITMCVTKLRNSKLFYISFLLEGNQYVFSTYNGGRIKSLTLKKRGSSEIIDVKIKQQDLLFNIRIIKPKGHLLTYPFENMCKTVRESINSTMLITMYKEDNGKYKNFLKTRFKMGACQAKV